MDTIFACPVCGGPLAAGPSRYACGNGHHYDRARQGYVNLLPQARRRGSGDSAEMLQARRRVLERGHYAPIAQGIAALYRGAGTTRVPGAGSPRVSGDGSPRVLDVGCGEGYYLRELDAAIGARCHGIDIAKTAAAMASRAHPAGAYAVGNSYRLPVLDSSADLVLKVFAPAPAAEIGRVLAPGGLVIEAIPRPAHMQELRRLIYRTDREHDEAFSAAEAGLLAVRDRVPVTAGLRLGGAQLVDLVRMTPYWHHADPGLRARLAQIDSMPVTLDCELRTLVPG